MHLPIVRLDIRCINMKASDFMRSPIPIGWVDALVTRHLLPSNINAKCSDRTKRTTDGDRTDDASDEEE
jgi:hypothetical protein